MLMAKLKHYVLTLIVESKWHQILTVYVESGGDKKATYKEAVRVNR